MQEIQVQSLGWEDPLEKEMQPTPVFLPGESHGRMSLVGYRPWGHKELDISKQQTDCGLTAAQIMNSLLPNSDLN